MNPLCRDLNAAPLERRHRRVAHDMVEGDDARGAGRLLDDALAFRIASRTAQVKAIPAWPLGEGLVCRTNRVGTAAAADWL